MTPSVPHKPRLHALWVIGTAFLGAAFLYGGLGTASAIAEVSDTKPTVAQETAHCVGSDTPAELAAALRAKAAELDERSNALDQRQAELDGAAGELRAQLEALEQAEASLAATLTLSERAAEDDLSRLTAVYEAMKPADAATLFSEMAPDFAAGFLARMSPSAAAGVLSGLEADQAYAISAFLAGRNANAHKE